MQKRENLLKAGYYSVLSKTMRSLGTSSQGAEISLWKLMPFLSHCLQLTGYWLLIWEGNPDSRIAISISSLWNELHKSGTSPLFAWITSHTGHTLKESRAPWCCAASQLLFPWASCWVHQVNSPFEELCRKSQREAVALGPFKDLALQWECRHREGCYTSTEEAFAGCSQYILDTVTIPSKFREEIICWKLSSGKWERE